MVFLRDQDGTIARLTPLRTRIAVAGPDREPAQLRFPGGIK